MKNILQTQNFEIQRTRQSCRERILSNCNGMFSYLRTPKYGFCESGTLMIQLVKNRLNFTDSSSTGTDRKRALKITTQSGTCIDLMTLSH